MWAKGRGTCDRGGGGLTIRCAVLKGRGLVGYIETTLPATQCMQDKNQ